VTSASAEAAKLKAIMAKHGVQCSIELQIGRPWAGDQWYSAKHVLMNHHTAGSNDGDTPSLGLVKKGRGADLPGPLCNGYGGRDLIYRVICMGLANHPGAGGPLTVAGFTLPKDSARISSWGTEWEHDGVSEWRADMQEFMGRSNAAICEYLGISASRSIEHKTWAPTRKIDRNTYTAATGQAEIRRWDQAKASTTGPSTSTPQEDDDMPTADEIADAVWAHERGLTDADVKAQGSGKVGDKVVMSTFLRFPPATARVRRELTALIGAQSATIRVLANAIAAGGSLTAEQAEQAATAGAEAALAKLGDLLDNDDTPSQGA
jgi:hypothetical protein